MADSESADICCLIALPAVLPGDSKGFACTLFGGKPGSYCNDALANGN